MALTDRQLLTIKHLKDKKINTPEEIVNWCKGKLNQPVRGNHRVQKHLRVFGRKHSRQYYEEIINFYGKTI